MTTTFVPVIQPPQQSIRREIIYRRTAEVCLDDSARVRRKRKQLILKSTFLSNHISPLFGERPVQFFSLRLDGSSSLIKALAANGVVGVEASSIPAIVVASPLNGVSLAVEDLIELPSVTLSPPPYKQQHYTDLYYFRPYDEDPHYDRPLCVYLPGIDGTGRGLSSQKPILEYFDVISLVYPMDNRQSWDELADAVVQIIESQTTLPNGGIRPVLLVGESFGGCLALRVAENRSDLIHRCLLVNPAVGYRDNMLRPLWDTLYTFPDAVYNTLPLALTPILINLRTVNADPLKVIERLMRLPDVLPPDCLRHRTYLLTHFSIRDPKSFHVPLLVVASANDLLLPSVAQAKWLTSILPNAQRHTLPKSGHACLGDKDVDLLSIMANINFIEADKKAVVDAQRAAVSKAAHRSKVQGLKGADVSPRHKDVLDWRPPSSDVIERFKGTLDMQSRLASPVFVGLESIPTNKPLLFVGNHTLYGFYDCQFLVAELFKRNIYVRGLGHPLLFTQPLGVGVLAGDRNVFEQFGAVPLTARNMYRLLEGGQNVLLFPGGIREAYHLKGEQYKLKWREDVDFVRMAIRHGATIVPFASIGADDAFTMLLDQQELRRVPVLSDWIRDQTQQMAERGMLDADAMLPPLSAPSAPARVYFAIGEAILTDDYKDKLRDPKACKELYARVRHSVEDRISFLLAKREGDPFKEFLPRIAYEATVTFPAPSFPNP